MKLNEIKRRSKTVTETKDVPLIKRKGLDTKPSNELEELISLENDLPLEIKFLRVTGKNFGSLIAKLPDNIQELISDSSLVFEIQNYT